MAFGRIVIGLSMAAIAVCIGLVLFLVFGASFSLALGVGMIVFLVLANIQLRIAATQDHRDLVANQNNMAEAVGHCMRQTTALTQRLDDLHMDISERTDAELSSMRSEVDLVAQAVRELADVFETETIERKKLSRQVRPAPVTVLQSPAPSQTHTDQQPQAPQPQAPQVSATPPPSPVRESVPPAPPASLGSLIPERGNIAEPTSAPVSEAPMIEATRRQFLSPQETLLPGSTAAPLQAPLPAPIEVPQTTIGTEPDRAEQSAEPSVVSDVGAHALFSEALEDGRAEIFLQPIVNLPQRKVQAYEAITRIRTLTAGFIDPDIYRPSIADHATIVGIDRLSLNRTLQIIARLSARGRDVKIFSPLSLRSISDGTFLNDAIRMLREAPGPARSLIFQLIQLDVLALGPVEDEALAALADAGAEFAIDNVEDFRFDMRELSKKRFRHARVTADSLVGGRIVSSDIHSADMSGLLQRHGMRMIATGVATERTVVDLLDFDVPLAQGNLFSTPRPVRSDILGDQSSAASSGRATA